MAEETDVVQRKPAGLRAEVEATRAGLVEKCETFEQGIRDTWQGANAAVKDGLVSAQATVETTVQAVRGALQDAGGAVGRALDVPAHARRHPWLLVGGALLLGLVAGRLVSRVRR